MAFTKLLQLGFPTSKVSGLTFACVTILLAGLNVYVAVHLAYNGDFWEHAAAVRALAADILNPRHPILNIDAKHHLFTPFHIITACLSKISGLSPTRALSVWGVINTTLFCLSVFLFCHRFFDRDKATTIALLALCLTLFGWGGHVWFFSGFLSIRAFAFIAPYPSTTCFALMLFALPLLDRWLATGRLVYLVCFLLAYSFVGLTHQITFVAMSVVAAAICGPKLLAFPKRSFMAAMVAVFTFLVILWWPYYSVIELAGNHREFTDNNNVMFVNVVERLTPALICLPAMLWYRRIGSSAVILLSFFGLVLCYLAGYMGWQPMLGRQISYVAFFGHLITATTIVYLIQQIRRRFRTFGILKRISLLPIALVIFVVLLPMFNYSELARWNRTMENQRQAVPSIKLLANELNHDEVVIAPINISFEIPAFSGKLIASRAALAFVPDHDLRRGLLEGLCNQQMEYDDALLLINEYKASKLLVPDTCKLSDFWFTTENLKMAFHGNFNSLKLFDIAIQN